MQRSESRTRFNRTIGVNRPARRTVAALLCLAGAIATGACLEFGLPRAHAASTFQSAYGIAMIGQPALPPDFSHLPYVNPDAPKGGRLVFGLPGTFDSLNPFIVKGAPVQQIRGYVVESLMARGQDEPFTLYGLLAQSLDTDDARSFVTFHLDPRARFSDGTPVTAEDVLFSWQLLRDKGRPNHQIYYSQVASAEAPDPLTVRFDFGGVSDRELPLILGLMPILPHHAIDPARFEETSLAPPLGSGPYRVSAVRAGASLTLTRNPDYWARDLPINRGLWNFDEVRIDFYREANGAFEAFKRGLYDFRREDEPLRWHEGYDFPAARRRRGGPRRDRDRAAKTSRISRLQHPPGGVRRHPGATGAVAAVRLRMGQPQLLLWSVFPRRRLFRGFGAVGLWPAGRTRERELLRRFDGVVRRTSWMAPSGCRSATDRVATAPRSLPR